MAKSESASTTEKKKNKVADATKENSVIEVDADNESFRGVAYVDQDIPESEKTPEWYIRNIHYISSFYNVAFESVMVPTSSNVSAPGVPSATINPLDRPIQRMLKNMMYYQGKQENIEYADWTTNTSGDSNYQPHWIKGQDIAELLNFMKGNFLERIVNLQITAKALSEDAASEMLDYRNQLLTKLNFKDVLAPLHAQGMQYNVGPKEPLQSEDQIDEHMKNFKQKGVDVITAMAKDVWFKQSGLYKFLDGFVKTLITGTAQVQHYVQNGKLFMRNIPSWQMIYDTRIDDDYNKEAQFVGIVETMTPTQIFSRFPMLNANQREEIKRMARTRSAGENCNTAFTNFLWWNYNVKREECVVSVVTAYWMGIHDMGLKKTKDKFEIDRIKKVEKGEDGKLERGEYVVDDIYKGTLIGNRYLVEFGLDDNIVEDVHDKSKPMFPIIRYLPNMVGGEPRAMVSRFTDMQDEIDALKYKVREMIGRAKGKCYIVRSDAGNNTQLKDIYKDFGTMGMTVVPFSGEDGADSRLLEMADFTLDPNIIRIEEIVRANRDLLKEYASVSAVALGQQTTYMGNAERASAIGQSTFGLASLYNGYMQFIQMNLQYAANVNKLLYTMDDNDQEAAFVVGDEGVQYLKVMGDMKFQDFLIVLQLNDALDETAKKNVQQLALAWAQNSVISPSTYIEVLRAETYSDALSVLQRGEEKQKKEKEADLAAQQQHDQAMQQQAMQAQQQNVAIQEQSKNQREELASQTKQRVALINTHEHPDLVNQQLQGANQQ